MAVLAVTVAFLGAGAVDQSGEPRSPAMAVALAAAGRVVLDPSTGPVRDAPAPSADATGNP